MSFKHAEKSCLPHPYNLIVKSGSNLELELLFQDDSEDMGSVWKSESGYEKLDNEEYVKSLSRSGAW